MVMRWRLQNNHLLGLQKTYVKITFRNVSDLMGRSCSSNAARPPPPACCNDLSWLPRVCTLVCGCDLPPASALMVCLLFAFAIYHRFADVKRELLPMIEKNKAKQSAAQVGGDHCLSASTGTHTHPRVVFSGMQ